jgi:cobalt-zinc-cadmium efflux system outer membrane protein
MVVLLAAGVCRCMVAAETPDAAPPLVLTLDEAVRWALAKNPSTRASAARVDEATGQALQARFWTNPELELSTEDWPVRGGRGFSDAKQTVGIAQTLPYPGKKSLDKQMGGAGVRLSEAQRAVRLTEIARDTKVGFYRVIASDRLVEVCAQLAAVAESSAAAARQRVDAGAATYQEQLRAELQAEQARTELAGFQREASAERQAFVTLLGRPDLKEFKLLGTLVEESVPALLEASAEGLMDRHPSGAAAHANLERAEAGYRRARLEPYPDVKVGLAGGWIGATDESIIQLGLTLPLPILDRGKGKQQQALALVRLAEAELQAVHQDLQREWANAQRRYRTAVEQVRRYRERILPKADEALRLVQTGRDEGKFTFMDLLDTQRTAAEVRLAYQQNLLEMNTAQAEVEALLQPQTLSSPPHPTIIRP